MFTVIRGIAKGHYCGCDQKREKKHPTTTPTPATTLPTRARTESQV